MISDQESRVRRLEHADGDYSDRLRRVMRDLVALEQATLMIPQGPYPGQGGGVTPCGSTTLVNVQVNGCNGAHVGSGTPVTLTGPGGFNSTVNTGSTGVASFNVTTTGAGLYTSNVAATTRRTGGTGSVNAVCGVTNSIIVNTTPQSGYHCWICAEPLADTLNATVNFSTGNPPHTVTPTFTYDATSQGWIGNASYTTSTVPPNGCAAPCAPFVAGSMTITHYFRLDEASATLWDAQLLCGSGTGCPSTVKNDTGGNAPPWPSTPSNYAVFTASALGGTMTSTCPPSFSVSANPSFSAVSSVNLTE